MESDVKKVNRGIGGIGAKPKKQNSQTQAKRHAEEKKKAEPPRLEPLTNEMIFRKIFGPETIKRDWSLVKGMIGDVLSQAKDYCWAIVFARLMQALYNQERPSNLQHEFSFLELVHQIKPGELENFSVPSLKSAIDHIAEHGVLKKPLRQSGERSKSKGVRIQENFHLYQDVDASFIRERIDKYPVGLILDPTIDFSYVGEGFYYLPKKGVITIHTRIHSLLLIGYGVTTDGKLYFIGQNSWGVKWGCRGYVRIIINEKCDIFCRKG